MPFINIYVAEIRYYRTRVIFQSLSSSTVACVHTNVKKIQRGIPFVGSLKAQTVHVVRDW